MFFINMKAIKIILCWNDNQLTIPKTSIMRKLLPVFLMLICSLSLAQNLQNSNWRFGEYAGVNFNILPASATTSSSNFGLQGGGASVSVSDKFGQLQFYSNGETVWGKNNAVMPNGIGLYGISDNYMHTQNTLIVPKPNHPGIYYLFTASYSYIGNTRAGLYYSMIDMCLNNGNGDIIPGKKNIPLKNHAGVLLDYDPNTNTGLKLRKGVITGSLNSDQTKTWVSVIARFENGTNVERYSYSYLVSDLGINNTSDGSPAAPNAHNLLNNAYYLSPFDSYIGNTKISPNGQYLCDATSSVVLYNFDNATGLISYNRTIYHSSNLDDASGYGMEFSPNSQLLYFSVHTAAIVQEGRGFGVKKHSILIYQNVIGSRINEVIGKFSLPDSGQDNQDNYTNIPASLARGLQLGVDNKIYVCNDVQFQPFYTWLGIIQQPNLVSTACDFIPNGINLPFNSFHRSNLPQWVHLTKNIWPKVYVGKANQNLIKDNNGNLFMSVHNLVPVKDQINHIGFTPAYQSGIPANDYEQYTLNFLYPGTNSTWGKPLQVPYFALSNGTVQLSDLSYVNSLTGAATTPPSFVPPGETIIGEIGSPVNKYLTLAGSALNIYTNSSSDVINVSGNIGIRINPLTNKLFYFQSGGYQVFDLINFNSIGGYFYQGTAQVLAVDNADVAYVLKNDMVQKVDPALGFVPVSIPGFTNSNIKYIKTNSYYTTDRIAVFNQTEKNLYVLDLNNATSRKIHLNSSNAVIFNYVFDGNDIYIAGHNNNLPFYLGNNLIPFLPYDCDETHNCFITKLNLQSDFTARPTGEFASSSHGAQTSFDFTISPNPVDWVTKLNITANNEPSKSSYRLSIINHMGRVVLNNTYFNGNDIKLYGLERGVYYIELVNNKGEKVAKKLLKRQ